MIVKSINNIRIEKAKCDFACKKLYPNGNVRLIRKRVQTVYRAIAPSGAVLYEDKLFKRVRTYAQAFGGAFNV